MKAIIRSLTTVFLVAYATGASAVPIAYTNPVDFFAALPGTASTLDFESSTAGDQIADGGTLGGVTFDYLALAALGNTLEKSDIFSAVSGSNYLSTDGSGFLNLDDLYFSFAASHAFGLFALTADVLFDGDLLLSAGGATASLSTADLLGPLPDGSDVYFLGVVDTENTFTTASLTGFRDLPDCDLGCFFYEIDDIITSPEFVVPIPVPPHAGACWCWVLRSPPRSGERAANAKRPGRRARELS